VVLLGRYCVVVEDYEAIEPAQWLQITFEDDGVSAASALVDLCVSSSIIADDNPEFRRKVWMTGKSNQNCQREQLL
jgi:hypothetical protein